MPKRSVDEEKAFLSSYDPREFPAVAVTVDLVVLTVREGELCVLLIERGAPPFKGKWALPGGFVKPDESLDEAARRELIEETSIDAPRGHLEQLGAYGDPDRDPRMRVVTVAYLGLMPNLADPQAGTDAASAQVLPVQAINKTDLAFDHGQILSDGIERARAKLEYTSLATAFLKEPFRLSELREIYEAVWGESVDPANFRRKVLSTEDFVRPAGNRIVPSETGGRPAQLYRRGRAKELRPPLARTGR